MTTSACVHKHTFCLWRRSLLLVWLPHKHQWLSVAKIFCDYIDALRRVGENVHSRFNFYSVSLHCSICEWPHTWCAIRAKNFKWSESSSDGGHLWKETLQDPIGQFNKVTCIIPILVMSAPYWQSKYNFSSTFVHFLGLQSTYFFRVWIGCVSEIMVVLRWIFQKMQILRKIIINCVNRSQLSLRNQNSVRHTTIVSVSLGYFWIVVPLAESLHTCWFPLNLLMRNNKWYLDMADGICYNYSRCNTMSSGPAWVFLPAICFYYYLMKCGKTASCECKIRAEQRSFGESR